MDKRWVSWVCLALCVLPAMAAGVDPEGIPADKSASAEEKGGGKPEVKALRFISDLDTPPFAFVDNYRNVGFEIDLGEALGKEMGRPVEWIKGTFNIPAFSSTLAAGRADAVLSSMTMTEGREQYFIFTIPYFRTSLAVATFRDVDWNSQAFRNGLTAAVKVGVLRRSTGEEWARKNLKATRKTYTTPDRLARALKNQEVEIILIDEPILRWTLANRGYKFKIVESGLDHQDYAIGVSRSNQALAGGLNAALEKLDASDVYDRIYEKWYSISQDLPKIGK
ncbi:MAG: ABC transporter substrate-binding protein [PVC group bacterium]